MTTTKAPTPPVTASPSKIVAFLRSLLSWILATILAPFKLSWATLKATGRVTIAGYTMTKNMLVTYGISAVAVILAFAFGASSAHIFHLKNPQVAAVTKTVTVPVVDTKTSAQIALISAQLDTIQKALAKQGAPTTPVAIPAAAQPETPAPVKRKAVPKKQAASGWFAY